MKSKIKRYNSLIEGLIANMPDVVKVILIIKNDLSISILNNYFQNLLDKGIEKSNENEDSPNYSVRFLNFN